MTNSIKQGTGSHFGQSDISQQRGQGMTEYIIIVALIAIAAIGIFGKFGDVVSFQMAATTNELAGTDGTQEVTSADAAATASTLIQADREISLNNYTDNGANDGG